MMDERYHNIHIRKEKGKDDLRQVIYNNSYMKNYILLERKKFITNEKIRKLELKPMTGRFEGRLESHYAL